MQESFLKSGRYSILASFLDKNKSYDNIVEIGGAGYSSSSLFKS